MDADEWSLLRKTNIEQGRKIEVLEQTIKKLTEPAGPRHVSADDLATGRERIDPRDIATGKVIVDMKEPEPVEVKAGEIHRNDPKLAEHLEEIATGKLRVVG
jgi:hypothetical protein